MALPVPVNPPAQEGSYVFNSPYPEISHLGTWTASSFKFGFGTDCLRDGDIETFWHSDGPQPHTITVQFPRKIAIQRVALLLTYQMDDSYTPAHLCIRAGTGANDMQDVRIVTYEKPNAWMMIDLSTEPVEDGEGFKPLHAYVVQVIVLNNHMNGKDTHIRGMKVLGPKEFVCHSTRTAKYIESSFPRDVGADGDPFPFKHSAFTIYQTIR